MLKSRLIKIVSILTCISLIMCMFIVCANALAYKVWQTSETNFSSSEFNYQVSALDSDGNTYNVTSTVRGITLQTNKGGTVSAPVVLVTDPNASFFLGPKTLFVDANNNVYLFYEVQKQTTNAINNDLYYVTNKSGSWVSSKILDSTQYFGFGSAVIDKNGAFHLCYADAEDNLDYISNASGESGDPELICPSDIISKSFPLDPAIAVDNNCSSYIAYTYEKQFSLSNPTDSTINYTTNKSGSWSTPVDVATCQIGFSFSLNLAVDNNYNVVIAYFKINTYDTSASFPTPLTSELFVISNASGSWVNTSVDKNLIEGSSLSLIFDSQNNVHIVYENYNPSNYNVDTKYATNVSGSWVASVFKTGTSYTAFSCGNNDRIQFLYQDSTATDSTPIMYAYKDTRSLIVTKGDINDDGKITASDALLALQAASGRITLTGLDLQAADVTGDGKVNAADALKILKYAAGKITSLS